MVPSRYDGAYAVHALQQTTRYLSLQTALPIAFIIHTLKVGKFSRVGRVDRTETSNVLNGDVTVPNDIAVLIEVLRGSVICNAGIHEKSSPQMAGLDRDIERLLRRDNVTRLRMGDDGRDHVGRGRYLPHGYAIAGSSRVLTAIGERLTNAEVDKVARISAGIR